MHDNKSSKQTFIKFQLAALWKVTKRCINNGSTRIFLKPIDSMEHTFNRKVIQDSGIELNVEYDSSHGLL